MATGGRIIAIGDVHGCVHALETLVSDVAPDPNDTIVLLGDLIDQGRDSAAVLDFVLELGMRVNVVLIRGNHEEMMLAARDSEAALRYWEICGGITTLNSYRYGAKLSDVPEAHWTLLEACRDFYETEQFIFTHANYLPDRPMDQQPEHQLRWALLDPEEVRPHISGKTVIVGHTEQRNSEVLDLGFVVCIDTACYRHGWLTAFEPATRRVWQVSRFGMPREDQEPTHRGKIPQPESVEAM